MESNSDIVLKVENLSVSFDHETVLHNISFEVNKNDAVAIIGPNGAGKTVLFRALLGLIPYQGVIEWKSGIRIGYVPQKLAVYHETPLTVKEFFLLQCGNFWSPDKNTVSHLNHELSLVGLSDSILVRPVAELSGGQLQRILIAWAMLHHPDVLLFDEPTAGIDVGAEETIYHLVHKLQDERGVAVLLISHDLNIIYRYAQRVICINKEMKCHGAPRDVLNPHDLASLYGEGAYYHHLENQK
ncbi:MAG TPA: metal ABC transporter ATP-binding protein [Candidatus Paceibacterota bacterium]